MADTDINLSVDLDVKDARQTAKDLQKEIEKVFDEHSDEQSKSLTDLEITMKKTYDQAGKLKSKLDELGKDVASPEYTKLLTDIAEAENRYDDLGDKIAHSLSEEGMKQLDQLQVLNDIISKYKEFTDISGVLGEAGKYWSPDELQAYRKELEGAVGDVDKLAQEQAQLGVELTQAYARKKEMESTGADIIIGKETEAYKETERELDLVNDKLKQQLIRHQDIKNVQEQNKIKEASKESQKTLKNLNDMSKKLTDLNKKTLSFAKNLFSSNKSSKDIGDSLKKSLKNFIRYTLNIRSLFALVNKLKNVSKEAFSVMAQEIGEVNTAISGMGTALKSLKASAGTVLQPLLNAIAPVIEGVVNKLVEVINAIAKFFATLTGQNYIYQATVANYDYADSVNAAKKANEGALASFDKLNVIGKENKSSDSMSLGADTVTYKKVEINPEDNWYTQLAQKISEGWKDADLSGVGATISDKLAGVLSKIPWKNIKKEAKKLGTRLGTLINGITVKNDETGTSDLATSIGTFIANAIDTFITSVGTFVGTVGWSNVGTFITDGLSSFFQSLRENDTWNSLGETLGTAIQGLISIGLEFAIKNPFGGVGGDAAGAVNTMVNKLLEIDPETGNTFAYDLGFSITTALSNLIQEIIGFLRNTDFTRVGMAVGEILNGLASQSLIDDIGTLIWELIQAGINTIKGAFDVAPIQSALLVGLMVIKTSLGIGQIFGNNLVTNLLAGIGNSATYFGNHASSTLVNEVATPFTNGSLAGALAVPLSLFFISEFALFKQKFGERYEEDDIDIFDWLGYSGDAFFNWSATEEAFNDAAEHFEEGGWGIVEGLGDGLKGAALFLVEPIGDLFSEVCEGFSEIFGTSPTPSSEPAEEVVPYGESLSNGIIEGMDNVGFTEIVDKKFNEIKDNLVAALGIVRVANTMVPYGEDITNGILEGMEKVKPVDTVRNMFQDMKAAIVPSVNTILGKIGEIMEKTTESVAKSWDSLSDFLGFAKETSKGIENGTISTTNIPVYKPPRLAQGAVLPPNKPFLAMVGDQTNGTNVEAPLATIKQALIEALGEQTITLDVNLEADSDNIFKSVRKSVQVYRNQTGGKSPF